MQREQAQEALARAEEALRSHEQLNRKRRQEREQWIKLGPANPGDVPRYANRLVFDQLLVDDRITKR